MGASRSLKAANEKALGKPLKGLTGNWKKASNRWNWSNRALAWDKYTAIQVSDKNLSYREQAETDTQASIAKIVNILRQCIEEENEEKYQKYSRKLNMLILGKGRAAELLLNVHKQLFGEKQQVENTHNFKHIVMLFE